MTPRRRSTTGTRIEVREDVYAPFGDDPLLLHDVTIHNASRHPQRLSWFEYWDVNPFNQATGSPIGLDRPRWDATTRTLSVAHATAEGSPPMSIFAATLHGRVVGHEASVAAFFGNGIRGAPAAVRADHLRGATAPAVASGHVGGTLFAFRTPVRLRAGQSIALRYAYRLAPRARIAPLVHRYARAPQPFAQSEAAWSRWLPKASFGRGARWVARELEWDAYLLRAASVDDGACGRHPITQGGYYQYSSGLNLGSRSWLHYLLPMIYADPPMAREILRYTMSLQSQRSGDIPYGTAPPCRLFNVLGTSDDLDF